MDQMACSVDVSHFLSPAISPFLAQQPYKQNGHGNQPRGYKWTQQCRLSFINTDLAKTTAEGPACTQFLIWHHSPLELATKWQVGYMEGAAMCICCI